MKLEVVYLGRRMTAKGKIAHLIIALEALQDCRSRNDRSSDRTRLVDAIDIEASLFSLKRAPASVGSIYSVPGDLEGSRIVRITGELEFARANADHADLYAAWKAADDAAYQKTKIKSMERAADADPHMTRALELLRLRYQRIAPANRRGFQLWLLNEIEKR